MVILQSIAGFVRNEGTMNTRIKALCATPLLFTAVTALLAGCMATAPVPVSRSEFPEIAPMQPNTPKQCAAFLGGWAGEWPNGNFGQLRLWVTSVDSSCNATYTYNGRPGNGSVSSGTLTVPCGGGECYFSASSDSMSASYSQSSSQRTTFGRIVPAN